MNYQEFLHLFQRTWNSNFLMPTFSKFPVNLTMLETTSLQKPGNSFGLIPLWTDHHLLWASQINPDGHKVDKAFTMELNNLLKIIDLHLQLIWKSVYKGKKTNLKDNTCDLTATTKWQEDNTQLKKSSVLWEGSVIIVEQQNLLLAPTIPCSKKHFFSLPPLSKMQPIKSIRCQPRPEEESSNPIN